MSADYSVAALVAAHTAFRDLMDAESGTAKIRIRSESGVLLAEAILDDPSGTVDSGTGQLTFSIDQQEDDAPAAGGAHHAQLVDGDDNVHLTLPCVQGTSAQPNACVVSSLSVVEGGEFNIVSAVIG